MTKDPTNPDHYRSHPSGVECIQITEHMGFNLGNAIKYIWRAGLKSPDPAEDLRKARWYLDREIARLCPGAPAEAEMAPAPAEDITAVEGAAVRLAELAAPALDGADR